jgi:aryl carrier-like protein
VFGSPGQSAYAAANASLDAMIEGEREAGRRGFSTINWGPWSGDGMLASVRNQFAQNSSVFEELDPHDALTLLERVISSAGMNFIAAGIRENESAELRCPLDVATITDAIWQKTTAHVNAPVLNQPGEDDLAGRLKAAPKWRQAPILMDYLCGVVSDLLELPEGDIDVQKPLKEIGIDSLYWVRLRNRLVADIGFGVSLTLIYSFPTIESISNHLLADESNPR